MEAPSRDVAVVGGGIVGLATAVKLLEAYRASVVVLEAESRIATHQTGRVCAARYWSIQRSVCFWLTFPLMASAPLERRG